MLWHNDITMSKACPKSQVMCKDYFQAPVAVGWPKHIRRAGWLKSGVPTCATCGSCYTAWWLKSGDHHLWCKNTLKTNGNIVYIYLPNINWWVSEFTGFLEASTGKDVKFKEGYMLWLTEAIDTCCSCRPRCITVVAGHTPVGLRKRPGTGKP